MSQPYKLWPSVLPLPRVEPDLQHLQVVFSWSGCPHRNPLAIAAATPHVAHCCSKCTGGRVQLEPLPSSELAAAAAAPTCDHFYPIVLPLLSRWWCSAGAAACFASGSRSSRRPCRITHVLITSIPTSSRWWCSAGVAACFTTCSSSSSSRHPRSDHFHPPHEQVVVFSWSGYPHRNPLAIAASTPQVAHSCLKSAGGGVQLERVPLLQKGQGGARLHGRQVHRPGARPDGRR